MEDKIELTSQGIMDAFRLLDKDLIDKILALSKMVSIERLENGVIRLSIDLVEKS